MNENAAVSAFVSMLFASRTQAHVFHLQTRSFAMHKALDDYYHGIVEHADDLIEACQGRYGIVTGYTNADVVFEGDEQVVPYFTELQGQIDAQRTGLPQESELQNIVDNIADLVDSTLYKLPVVTFADRAAKAQRRRKGTLCTAGLVFDALDPSYRAEVEAALADPSVYTTTIAELLREDGHDLSAQNLHRHRRRRCACP